MAIYEIERDLDSWGVHFKYQLDARHKWGLPGVRCPVCGATWGCAGVQYPVVDLSALVNVKLFEKSFPVPLNEFIALRDQIRSLVPSGCYLPPGTRFGSLHGKARGTFGDFAWLGNWTPLMQREAFDRLNTTNVSVRGVPAELTFKAGERPELLELYAEPLIRLTALSPDRLPPCSGCGRQGVRRPVPIVVVGSSIPQELDIFRGRELPTAVFVSQRFADAVAKLQLTDIRLQEVAVE